MPDDAALQAAVKTALDAYVDPYLREPLSAAEAVRDVRVTGGRAAAQIQLGFPVGGYREEMQAALQVHLRAAGVELPLDIDLQSNVRPHAVQRHLKPLGEIKNVVA